jgi:DNA-binding transcriptional regulator YiaG
VTLSRWECDKVYPTWEHHPRLIEYLDHDPFVSCGLQDPYGNETQDVASLSSATVGKHIRLRRLELKMTVKKCAQILKVDAKTLHGWEKQRHQPAPGMQKRLIEFLDP